MIINANALHIPPYCCMNTILWYNKFMDKNKGRFKKGEHRSPATEFKKGTHWRSHKPYWEKDWLISEYIDKGRSSTEIAEQFGVGDTAILFWLNKHGIQTRTTSETRKIKHWGNSGEDNPMYGKTGDRNHNWKGGCTPERQSFYMSKEWVDAASFVWSRDQGKCQRCGARRNLHIHHIISFANKETRADPANLVLLCRACHIFIHSKKNKNKEFLQKEVRNDY